VVPEGLVRMRKGASYFGIFMILLVSLFPIISSEPFSFSNSDIQTGLECIPLNLISNDSKGVNLTWASRMQLIPQLLENDSKAVGDHVELNATFTQTQNVTECNLNIWNIQANVNTTVSCLGSSISFDTYYLDSSNQTYSILVNGTTNTNDSILVRWENVSICNFFAPEPTAFNPTTDDDIVFNITWTCEERNLIDANYYDVWLSNNDGVSYMLVMRNLTQTWYIWNSTGWFEGIYIARIRAYSVDYSSSECRLDDPPSSYWPGDFGDAFTCSFPAGDNHPHIPSNYFILDTEIFASTSYYFGSTENIITVHLKFDYYLPSSVRYYVYDDGNYWLTGEFRPQLYSENFTINIDGLPIGTHVISILITEYSTSRNHTITINVTEPIASSTDITTNPQDWSSLIQVLAFGVSIGSVAIIAVVLILTIRLRRNRVIEYE